MEEQDLLAKGYRRDSRSVGDVRKRIQLVKSILKNHETGIRQKVRTSNPVYLDIQKELYKAQAELDSQQAGAAMLVEQIDRLDHEIRSLDEKQDDLRNLERAVEINETNYLTYVEKHEEARISDDLDRQKIANISVIQTPSIPQKPVEPKKRIAILLATLLGMLLGIGYALFTEFTSQRLSTPEEVQRRLGVPALAAIPLRQA
jgi:polysaccharide biosynthesis protein PslE